jgi:hypothetical protein
MTVFVPVPTIAFTINLKYMNPAEFEVCGTLNVIPVGLVYPVIPD